MKVLHLKAIELVAKIVPSSTQFLNHLIASFYKNYKSDMDAIVTRPQLRTKSPPCCTKTRMITNCSKSA